MGEMLDRILEGLNEAQRDAVLTARGPLVILAGAGTGKTTTVTRRIAAQVAVGTFAPDQILAVTFSAKAAGELRGRLAALGVQGVRAMTFHAEALGQYRRFVSSDTEIVAGKARLLLDSVRKLPAPHKFVPLREFATEIEWAKNRRIAARDYLDCVKDHEPPIPAEQMHRIYVEYEKAKRRRNAIDFEDLLEKVVSHLAEHDRDLGIVRSRYAAFTVDEYQDVNVLQQTLLETLLGRRDDVCVVGDDYQSIYGFTGASPSYLLKFADRYPDATVITLTDNHRSTPEILQIANRLVPKLGGSGKRLRATLPSGAKPAIHVYASGEDEVAATVKTIRAEMTAGTPLREIAILFRINSRTEPYEEALTKARIPYQVAEGSFLQRAAAKSFLARCRGMDPATATLEAVIEITDGLGFDPEPDPGLGDNELTRQQDLARLRAFAETSSTDRIDSFVAELRDRFDGDSNAQGVRLLTLHRSKGLEFEVVFIPELEEGLLPISHARSDDEIAEERRLLYVGLTRARRRLELSRAASRPSERRKQPKASRFVAELKGDEPTVLAPAGPRSLVTRKRLDGNPHFEALRGWRATLAKQQGVPAYIVFPDSTLIEIASRVPKTREELRSISGVGPLKMSRYGDDVLGVLEGVRAS
jgi:DNA helicase II / ATP-dependent DNA helicase PcrA